VHFLGTCEKRTAAQLRLPKKNVFRPQKKSEFGASIEGCVQCYVVLINLGRLSVVCNAVLLRDHSSLLDVAQSIGYKAVAC